MKIIPVLSFMALSLALMSFMPNTAAEKAFKPMTLCDGVKFIAKAIVEKHPERFTDENDPSEYRKKSLVDIEELSDEYVGCFAGRRFNGTYKKFETKTEGDQLMKELADKLGKCFEQTFNVYEDTYILSKDHLYVRVYVDEGFVRLYMVED